MGYGLSRYPLNTGDVQFVGDVTVRITSPPPVLGCIFPCNLSRHNLFLKYSYPSKALLIVCIHLLSSIVKYSINLPKLVLPSIVSSDGSFLIRSHIS